MLDFMKYSKEENEEMLLLTLDIGDAVRELTTFAYTDGTIH
jgi:hypothetical protein